MKNKNKGESNNKVVLIFLIVFVIISITGVFVVKLAQWGYFNGKKNTTNSSGVIINNLEKTVNFQGVITGIDTNNKTLTIQGINISQIGKDADGKPKLPQAGEKAISQFNFSLANDCQITLQEGNKTARRAILGELKLGESVSVTTGKKDGETVSLVGTPPEELFCFS